MKIPEDYTFYGSIFGSVKHLKNNVSSKLRSKPFKIDILGKDNLFQWGNI
jgi:hypothetical protein